ncbi:MAG: c-type cytochrome [Devosia sp.]
MPLSKFAATAAVAFVAGAVALAAYAQDLTITPDPALTGLSAEQAVDKRQQTMKLNGATLKVAGGLTGAEAVKAADTLISNFSNLTVLFPEGSDQVPGSEALPVIWQNWDTFQGNLRKGVGFATQLKAAAQAGDAAAYAAALKSIGGLCGQCHQKFRAS